MSGRGTAAGMDFQAEVGGFLAALLLTARPLSRLLKDLPGTPTRLLFEVPAPVDDILVETDREGVIHLQAKRNPSLSGSHLTGVADQFVRQFLKGKERSGCALAWDADVDRLVLAVSDAAPNTIKEHVREALERNATGAVTRLPKNLENALKAWSELIASAWQKYGGAPPTDEELGSLLKLCRVVVLGTAQHGLALEILRDAVAVPGNEGTLIPVLCKWASESSATGTGGDVATLRRHVVDRGIGLAVPEDYRKDVARLKTHSEATLRRLGRFRSLRTADGEVRLERAVTAAVIRAAPAHSFLVTGEPGAGKSAVLHATAERLAATSPVIVLAVDDTATSLDALRREIGLEHPIADVLRACTDVRPAFLVIDALDAARGGLADTTYHKLIEAVRALDGWRVIASVRSFDLRMGRELRETFAGEPPDPAFADKALNTVSHLHVPLLAPEELAEVKASAPAIATALTAAGPKLLDLSRNPFNMSILAEVVTNGADALPLASVTSRGQLLERYWSERIEDIGSKGGIVIARLVERMIDRRATEISEADIDPGWAEVVDELTRRGILFRGTNRRRGFRHHVLFDYAVARLWLSADPERARDRLAKRAANGLFLAPALGYWLEERFRFDDSRTFWALILRLIADEDVDPIARLESARFVVEAASEADALAPLSEAVLAAPEGKATTAAVHILRAARDRLVAGPPSPIAPWAAFAAGIAPPPRALLGELRSLIAALLEHPLARDHRSELGAASRHLLDVLLDDETLARVLSPTVVPLVARTFATDPKGSKDRLLKLFEPARFARLGHVEVPWLARDIEAIVAADPEFAADIYRRVFAAPSFSRDEPTSLASSWILSLTSNAAQDFDMAKFSLAEAYSKFLARAPVAAAEALSWTLQAARERRSAGDEGETRVVSASGTSFGFEEDRSHIWAWNIDWEQIHDHAKMYQAFLAWAGAAPTEDLRAAVAALLTKSRLALVWRAALEAGASRPEVLGDQLWSLASHPTLLLARDTQRAAIRLIAAVYPSLAVEERKDFEEGIERFDYSRCDEPEEARSSLMAKLFAAIGAAALVTDNARASLRAAEASGAPLDNDPPFRITTDWCPAERPTRTGADAETLRWNDRLEKSLSAYMAGKTTELALPVEQEVWRLQGLLMREATALAPDVADTASDTLARAAGELLATRALDGARREALLDLLLALSEHPLPAATAETEAEFARSPGWGSPCPRLQAAEALARQLNDPNAYAQIAGAVERLSLSDPHPAVRMMVVQRLNTMWEVERADMWRLIERVAAQEPNPVVLRSLIPVLKRLGAAEAARAEGLFFTILDRLDPQDQADDGLAHVLVFFAFARNLPRSQAVLERWLADFAEAEGRLRNVLSALRDLLVLGYDGAEEAERQIGVRARAFARAIVATLRPDAAAWVARGGEPTPKEIAAVKLLDELAEQLFLAAGAAGERKELVVKTDTGRRAFLADVQDLIRALADLGTPNAVHSLLRLLEPLIDVDAVLCFALISEALLRPAGIGRYEHEPLGASLFVELVGRYLADHRDLFEDEGRRRTLLDCLGVFVDAGWPEARRLLQSLPDMLA